MLAKIQKYGRIDSFYHCLTLEFSELTKYNKEGFTLSIILW